MDLESALVQEDTEVEKLRRELSQCLTVLSVVVAQVGGEVGIPLIMFRDDYELTRDYSPDTETCYLRSRVIGRKEG